MFCFSQWKELLFKFIVMHIIAFDFEFELEVFLGDFSGWLSRLRALSAEYLYLKLHLVGLGVVVLDLLMLGHLDLLKKTA